MGIIWYLFLWLVLCAYMCVRAHVYLLMYARASVPRVERGTIPHHQRQENGMFYFEPES